MWKFAVSRVIAALPRFLRPASAASAAIIAPFGHHRDRHYGLLGVRAQ